MFLSAFARPATSSEVDRATDFMQRVRFEFLQHQHTLLKLRTQIADLRKLRNDVLAPIRSKLEKERLPGQSQLDSDLPQPIGRWEFDGDVRDSVGGLHGTIHGDASVVDGALVLLGGYVQTSRLQQNIREKTLLARLQLNNLTQRGGGGDEFANIKRGCV